MNAHLPFWIYSWVWLYQQPSPLVLYFEEKCVRVSLKVICTSFYEETILHLAFEYHHIQIHRLAKLSKYIHFVIWI